MKLVSAIVCTRDRADHLRQTLKAFADVAVPPGMACELIVIDNGSTDHTADVIRQCRLSQISLRSVCEPGQGLCHARNAGLAAAQGEIILFTDDDVRPPREWIEAMTAPILRGEADAVAGGVRFAPHLLRPWMEDAHRWSLADTSRLDPAAPSDMVGANMAFSKDVLAKVDTFDTETDAGALGFCGDSLFSWQLKEAGFRIGSALNVTVEHHFQKSRLRRTSFLAAAKKYGQSFAYLAYHWKHDEPANPRLLLAKRRLRLTYWRAKRRREMVSPRRHTRLGITRSDRH